MRSLLLALLALALAPAGIGAATLTLESDASVYGLGDTIVLTVTGLSEGAAAKGLTVVLTYEAALTAPGSGESQTPHTSANGSETWIAGGSQGVLEDGRALLLEQISPSPTPSVPRSTDPTATVGTVELIAEAVGTVHVDYYVQPGDSLTMNYFGITSSPGGITFEIVPEPTTASLLALGLAWLALVDRRSRG